jgi:hypothetical protein
MKVEVLTTQKALLDALRQLGTWAESISIVSAWAGAAHGTADHWSAIPAAKLERALIGTQFAQTEPWVMRELHQRGVLRLRYDLGSTFHPKLVLGQRNGNVRAIVGSSNFTVGGYGRNTELNLLLRGTASDSPLAALQEFVDTQWDHDDTFVVPDAAWLDIYEAKWRKRISTPTLPLPQGVKPGLDDLEDLSWREYYALIKDQHGRPLGGGALLVFGRRDSYLYEIRGSRRAFGATPRFQDMDLEDRLFALGLGQSSGAMGRMKGAGKAVSVVMKKPSLVGRYLDLVPVTGPVSESEALAALEGMCSMDRFSLGVASRLLAAKRPDLFLPINAANKVAIRALIGAAPGRPSTYLALHKRLWATPWFQESEPVGKKQRSIWRGRVALLDAVLYDGRGS